MYDSGIRVRASMIYLFPLGSHRVVYVIVLLRKLSRSYHGDVQVEVIRLGIEVIRLGIEVIRLGIVTPLKPINQSCPSRPFEHGPSRIGSLSSS
jgi:hypothetical protein